MMRAVCQLILAALTLTLLLGAAGCAGRPELFPIIEPSYSFHRDGPLVTIPPADTGQVANVPVD